MAYADLADGIKYTEQHETEDTVHCYIAANEVHFVRNFATIL